LDLHRKLLIYDDFCLQPTNIGASTETTGRCAIKRFTGATVLIHKPKNLGNSWIVTSIFTMPILSSHVEIVVIYPPGSISGNILGFRLLDGYWRVSNGETTDLGDPKVEKQLIWELFSSMER
jgi:hypothetical protein